jgi:hypothetical protein
MRASVSPELAYGAVRHKLNNCSRASSDRGYL